MHNAVPVPITEDELLASPSRWQSPRVLRKFAYISQTAGSLGRVVFVEPPLHLRPACTAYGATSRQDPSIIDPRPESNTNMRGCCTNKHLALTTKEMPAAVGGVECCAFTLFFFNCRHILKQKGCETSDADSPATRSIEWYLWCKFNPFFFVAWHPFFFRGLALESVRQKKFWTSWRTCRASQRRLMLSWPTSLLACPIFRWLLPVTQVFSIVLDQSSTVKSMIQFIIASRCFVCRSMRLDYILTTFQKQRKIRATN